ncbi:MAG TPA: group III truncated hemoglobin [Acidobacteriaceae bacterium]|nr:group III truncated hemoglobin [Acidobacteriaceae bacterium]
MIPGQIQNTGQFGSSSFYRFMTYARLITEDEISTLVDQFYRKVRADPMIGPIFNARIEDWPAHLTLLKKFWSTVLLTTGTYRGDPLAAHLSMPIAQEHFDRWLALFAETALEILPPEHSNVVVRKSERIAKNFQLAIAHQISSNARIDQTITQS